MILADLLYSCSELVCHSCQTTFSFSYAFVGFQQSFLYKGKTRAQCRIRVSYWLDPVHLPIYLNMMLYQILDALQI